MRGRRPLGPGAVTRLEGSETARKKMEVLLEAMTGHITVGEACVKLGVGEAAYHKLRQRMLQGAMEGLEPRTPGRPAQVSIVDPKVVELEEEVRQLRIDLRASQIRDEIALLMPHLIKVPDPTGKKRGRRARRAKGEATRGTNPEDL
jgi:hypothetical protein